MPKPQPYTFTDEDIALRQAESGKSGIRLPYFFAGVEDAEKLLARVFADRARLQRLETMEQRAHMVAGSISTLSTVESWAEYILLGEESEIAKQQRAILGEDVSTESSGKE